MKCQTKYCRRVPAKRSKSKFCARCKTAKDRENNPISYFLRKLRGNAARRGIDCTLTWEEFKRFCDETGYLQLRGRRSGCKSIERINDQQGYTYENIIILEIGENSRRAHIPYFQRQKVGGMNTYSTMTEADVRREIASIKRIGRKLCKSKTAARAFLIKAGIITNRACKCPERHLPIKERDWSLESYRVRPGRFLAQSKASTIRCLQCNAVWRTSAAFVEAMP